MLWSVGWLHDAGGRHTCAIKGAFIATQLNSTSSGVELRRYKRALSVCDCRRSCSCCAVRHVAVLAVDLLRSVSAVGGLVSNVVTTAPVKLTDWPLTLTVSARWSVCCPAIKWPVRTFPSEPRRSLQPPYSKVCTVFRVHYGTLFWCSMSTWERRVRPVHTCTHGDIICL